jgi:uncharacterized protein YegP (UPF0339 family)
MATATQKVRPAARPARNSPKVPTTRTMRFDIVEDNAGDFHWMLVGDHERRLAVSESFASHADAALAVNAVSDALRR